MVMLQFEKQAVEASFINPGGRLVRHRIEQRTDPISGRTSRITFARQQEMEPGTEVFPEPPPQADEQGTCPFCRPRVKSVTPQLDPAVFPESRLQRGNSLLFPNLFPYGKYSAVSTVDDSHFVEIGTAAPAAYTDCLLNCRDYLQIIRRQDPGAVYMAVTQNHLPSAGGSLVHPHLQIHADPNPTNTQRQLEHRARSFRETAGELLFSAYLRQEQENGERYIGRTGSWHWLAAYAPEGFYEIWGILPEAFFLSSLNRDPIPDLARGIINVQKFYRSLNRNSYNLGIIAVETAESRLELRVVLVVRSNYAPWVRNDQTGFEMMLGEMATFTAPEETAERARGFFAESTGVADQEGFG